MDNDRDTSKSLMREYLHFKYLEEREEKKRENAEDPNEVQKGHPNIIEFLFFCIEESASVNGNGDGGPEVQYFIGVDYFKGEILIFSDQISFKP